MRRANRETTDLNEIKKIVDECKVLRIATKDEEGLYVVPLNFGYSYENGKFTFYFHSAKEGRKIDAFKANEQVAFEMDCEHELLDAGKACGYSYKFASIIGTGSITFLEGEEKLDALSILMKHQTGKNFTFNEKMAKDVAVCSLSAEKLTAKANR